MRLAWPQLAFGAGFIGLAGLFAQFGSELVEGELRGVDVNVRSAALRLQSPAAHAVFTGVTQLGVSGVLVAVCLLLGWRVFRLSWQQLVVIAACALLSGELVGLLKRSFGMPRPLGGLRAGLGYSFPSGHSAGAMASAVILSYLSVRARVRARLLPYVFVGVALLVGVSRVMLDLHWFSDVLGGWLVGAAFGAGSAYLLEAMR